MKIITIFDSFLIIPIFTLLSIVYYSFAKGGEYALYFIFYSAVTIVYIFMFNFIFAKNKIKELSCAKISDVDIGRLKIIMWLSFLTMVAYLFISGFPLLSQFPEDSKTQVTQHPILVRFYRIAGLVPLVVYILVRDERIKKTLIYYCFAMIICGFLTAFKGYPVPYVVGLICIFCVNFLRLKNIIFIFILVFILLIFFSVAANIQIDDVFSYVMDRFSFIQLLGTVELINNYKSISYYPVISEIALLPMKIFTDDAMSLQQILYQSYHIFDVNKLELANFYIAELHLFYGVLGVFFFAILFALILIFLRNLKMTPFVFSYIIIINISVMDGFLNGKLVFRIMDAVLILILSGFIVTGLKLLKLSTSSVSLKK